MPEPITCRELVELVTDYFEGVLDPATEERFRHHLELCPGCDTYVEQMRETARLVGRLDEEHLSDAGRSHLLDAFRTWKAPSTS